MAVTCDTPFSMLHSNSSVLSGPAMAFLVLFCGLWLAGWKVSSYDNSKSLFLLRLSILGIGDPFMCCLICFKFLQEREVSVAVQNHGSRELPLPAPCNLGSKIYSDTRAVFGVWFSHRVLLLPSYGADDPNLLLILSRNL